MKSSPPFDKVELIQRSLRCFSCGLIGVLPGIGLPFAVVSLSNFFRVLQHRGSTWNPAENYLGWGATLSTIGLLLGVILVLIIMIEA